MSSVLTVKLRRDLLAARSRFVLMAIAIAVSLTVFGGVLFAWDASRREVSEAYLATEPASATILLDEPIGAEHMAALASEVLTRPGVIEAVGRSQFTGDVEVNGRLRENPLQVFVAAPDDPMTMAIFDVEQGSWPPPPGGILIGRDSLNLLDVSVGDSLRVDVPGGDRLSLRVAGIVYDPSLAPAPQQQTAHAYLPATSLAAGGGVAELDQLKIQVADRGESSPTRDRDAIVAVASGIGEWLEGEQGLAVREIQVPEPYAHPHQGQANALLLALLAGGGVALVLSTIVAATMLNNLFMQQIPQIGIMKAIGAGAGRIVRFYITMTVIVSAAATLIALGPAILFGRALTGEIFGFLGIKADSLAPAPWTYMAVVGAGLLLPQLMASIPLVKASRTTVRAAIDHHGTGSKPGRATRVLTTQLSRISRLDRGLLLALRNTVRRPARFVLSVGLLASAGAVFVSGMSLSSGAEAVAEEAEQRRNWDVQVQLARPVLGDEVTRLVQQVPGVSRAEGWMRIPTGVATPGQIPLTRTYPDQGHGSVSVTAVPAATTMLPPPNLLDGRWLEPGETGAVVLNQIVREDTVPGVRVGDTVQLLAGGESTTWRVVGIVQEREGAGGVYTTAEGLAEALGQPLQVNQLRIVTDSHDESTRHAVAGAADEILTSAGVDVASAESISLAEAATEGHLGPIIAVLLGIAVAMAIVGGVGLASTMSANILDRTREFGVMHAVGARPKTVRRIVIAEGVFMALTSCLVAALPALGLTALMGAGLGNLFMSAPLPFRVSAAAAAIWVGLAVLGAVLATEAAATRASRLTVREALAYL